MEGIGAGNKNFVKIQDERKWFLCYTDCKDYEIEVVSMISILSEVQKSKEEGGQHV